MSLDNLSECADCGAHASATLWMQFFGSMQEAHNHGSGPDFMSFFLRGPMVLKVHVCLSCKNMKLAMNYTPEEEAAQKKYAEDMQKKNKTLGDMGELFGGLFGKKPV